MSSAMKKEPCIIGGDRNEVKEGQPPNAAAPWVRGEKFLFSSQFPDHCASQQGMEHTHEKNNREA
jgi:hypothetical protein